jgi:hypothetical protein
LTDRTSTILTSRKGLRALEAARWRERTDGQWELSRRQKFFDKKGVESGRRDTAIAAGVVRSHWRGWNIVLFEDRAGQHTLPDSREWAEELGIEVRLLPKATPELNAMDHLWRHTKREALGDRETVSIDGSALDACQYIIDLRPTDRLRLAGVLSGNFWLTK